jgi:SAM-dependent methyltransferase
MCPLCGSSAETPAFRARDYEHAVAGEWQISRCGECDLYFQSPMPRSEELPGFYPPSYSAYNSNTVISALFRLVYWLDARRVASLIGPQGSILDVGCGNGSALGKMRELGAWSLSGLELDSGAVRAARARGLDVRQGDVLSSDFPPSSFDLIRMGHVIEHVLDPKATVARIYSLLRPGGVFFGETPNTECADFRLFGRYWGALHVPRHLTFFNRKNLRELLEQVGFRDVSITPRLRTVGWSCAIQNALADKFGLKVPPTGRVSWYPLLIAPFLPFTVLQALFGTTATVAFVAKKPG